jgi:hypothetical protein
MSNSRRQLTAALIGWLIALSLTPAVLAQTARSVTVPATPPAEGLDPERPPIVRLTTMSATLPAIGMRVTSAGTQEAQDLGIETPVGAVIAVVQPDSPGAAAGLQVGDLVTHFGDLEVKNYEDFEAELLSSAPGQGVSLRIVRDDTPQSTEIELGRRDGEVQIYTHPTGVYRLKLPTSWKDLSVEQSSGETADVFDSWEGNYRLECLHQVRKAPDTNDALDSFVGRSLQLGWSEAQRLQIATESAAFVSRFEDNDVNRPRLVYLVGFVRNELFCEFKVQAPVYSDVAKLPNVIQVLLQNELSETTSSDAESASTTGPSNTSGKVMDGQIPESSTDSTTPAEVWYFHGQNRYRLRIPQGWVKIQGHRNTKKDTDFDTIQSPDGRYKVVCSRLVRQVGESDLALDAYREGQLTEVAQYAPLSLVPFQIASAPALRIGYQLPKSKIAIWRMAVVHNKERFVINLIVPNEEFDEDLPQPIKEMLDSLVFLAE